jgi:hypothetical protein
LCSLSFFKFGTLLFNFVTGCIYLGYPCCEAIIFIFVVNCSFFCLCKINCSVLLLLHFIYAYADVFLAIEKDTTQHECVWKCYCTFQSIVEVKFLACVLNVTHSSVMHIISYAKVCISMHIYITIALIAVLNGQ